MGFKSETCPIVVEYDGDGHYCNTLKIKADIEKDRIASEQGHVDQGGAVYSILVRDGAVADTRMRAPIKAQG